MTVLSLNRKYFIWKGGLLGEALPSKNSNVVVGHHEKFSDWIWIYRAQFKDENVSSTVLTKFHNSL